MKAKTAGEKVGKWERGRPGAFSTCSLSHLLTCGLSITCGPGRAPSRFHQRSKSPRPLPRPCSSACSSLASCSLFLGASGFLLNCSVWPFSAALHAIADSRGALGTSSPVIGYQQQRLLLAASPSGVALVSHLPSGDDAPANPVEPAPASVASPSFVRALQQAIQRKT